MESRGLVGEANRAEAAAEGRVGRRCLAAPPGRACSVGWAEQEMGPCPLAPASSPHPTG